MKRLVPLLLLTTLALPAAAQRTLTDDPWCTEREDAGEAVRACEVREFTLAPRRTLAVEAGDNGGISVEAWDRDEVLVRARIQAKGASSAEARRLLERVAIETDGTIRPRVPRARRDAWASVSFRLMVPRRSDLALRAHNGGIGIDGVSGAIEFATRNGGVHLDGVGGDVRGRTTNGGLDVHLAGDRWAGDRLDVETTNGGIRLVVPDGYSADLETGTVNGGLRLGFPVTVEGDVGRRVRTRLGDGGRPVRVVTTNGGVVVERG
jgi:DUF4097 and DUF4098 domain-containing protein YvlB